MCWTALVQARRSATLLPTFPTAGVRPDARAALSHLAPPAARLRWLGKGLGTSMLASSFIVLLTTGALASSIPDVAVQASVLHVSSAPRVRRPLPSPTIELRKSTEALRKTLARRHPAWSPEAEVQAASVQT